MRFPKCSALILFPVLYGCYSDASHAVEPTELVIIAIDYSKSTEPIRSQLLAASQCLVQRS